MKKYLHIFVLAVLPLALLSCKKTVLKGKGEFISETRSLSSFSKISMDGSNDVTIVKDTESKVILSGYSNLIAAYETKVNGNRLNLDYEDKYWNISNDNLNIEVHTPHADEMVINGSGDMVLREGFNEESLTADINGSGNMDIIGGMFDKLYLNINGSGNINSGSSDAKSAVVHINGSGDVHVKVSDYLNVKIDGSGDVTYIGTPRLETSINGSGDVRRR